MKFKMSFKHSIEDGNNPKRHSDIDFDLPLEFPFPKNVEDKLQEMKRDMPDEYKKFKDKQFLDYTGTKPEKFQADFTKKMQAQVKANYEAQIVKSARPNFTPVEWAKITNLFQAKQAEMVKLAFEKQLSELAKVAYDKLTQLKAALDKVQATDVTLDAEESFVLWLGKKPLTFTLQDKFKNDHIAGGTSHSAIIEKALGRYKKNKTTTSSWIALAESSLVGKANGGAAYPCLHSGAQQIAVKIKCDAGDVSVVDDFKTKGDKQRADAAKSKWNYEIETDRWVSVKFNSITEFYVLGKWNPENGEAELYHFQTDKPKLGMLDKFKKWRHDPKTGKYEAK